MVSESDWQYNLLAKEEGVADKMRAIKCDVSIDASPLEGKKFGLIIVSVKREKFDTIMLKNTFQCAWSYHHLISPATTTAVLSKYISPSGYFVHIDWHPDNDPIPVQGKFLNPHESFSEAQMKEIYEAGDVELVKYELAFDMMFRGIKRRLFISVGQKRN